MHYVGSTPQEVKEMLAAIGAGDVDELFSTIPPELRAGDFPFPAPLSHPELAAHVGGLAAKNWPAGARPFFLGGGCVHRFIPPVVDALASRGEFVTAYTPYQPEAAQGTLQVGFEFQSLICELTGLEVANASLYEGATALVEAVLMVFALESWRHDREDGSRCGRSFETPGRRRFLVSEGIHPEYRKSLRTYCSQLRYEIEEVPLEEGKTSADRLRQKIEGAVGVAFQSPSFFGIVEDAEAIASAAREAGAQSVQVVEPVSLSLLAPPGETGVEVACGDGQSLGLPMSVGGPSLGILAAKSEFLRKFPGRLVGRTHDADGATAYVTTLQTREQHIRREKATSNICTNAALMATRATIYLAAMGKNGLREVAEIGLRRAHHAAERIAALPGFALRFSQAPFFNELAVRCPLPAAEVNRRLQARGITGGLDLGRFDAAMSDSMLLCFTELTTPDHVDQLVTGLRETCR